MKLQRKRFFHFTAINVFELNYSLFLFDAFRRDEHMTHVHDLNNPNPNICKRTYSRAVCLIPV